MNSKKIWIVNYYTTPPEYVSNPRHLEFSANLKKAGYDVTILSASFLKRYNIDLVENNKKFEKARYGSHSFIHIKVKSYKSNGIARMISLFQFAWRIFLNRKHFVKPDIILHNIHAPFDYPIFWCAKKLDAKYIVEAWDLWPDSFVRFGLIGKHNPLTYLAYAVEKRFYQKADKVIFSFEGGKDYLTNKKWTRGQGGKVDLNKVYYINNGVNMLQFNSDLEKFQIQDPDLSNNKIFKVVYLGSLRLVNNIKTLIDTAKTMASYQDIKFLIYGDGTDREFLERYCIENAIENVVFKEKWMPLKYIPYVLSKSSVNILNYQKGFGIYGTSSGKLFQYLAAGKPICSNIKMNYCLVEKFNLGIARNLETPQDYANSILQIYKMDSDSYDSMCNRVLDVAKKFDYTVLSDKLTDLLIS